MEIERIILDAFSVAGKETSTNDGEDSVQKAWKETNEHFNEIYKIAKKDSEGNVLHCWGLMSDFNRKLLPWADNFSKGLYLAGVEVEKDVEAPRGWTKWDVPKREYLRTKIENQNYQQTFQFMVNSYILDNGYEMIGAAFDYTDLKEKEDYICFPIKKKE